MKTVITDESVTVIDPATGGPYTLHVYKDVGSGVVITNALPIIPDAEITYEPKCECGAHKVGSNAHSSWCDLA